MKDFKGIALVLVLLLFAWFLFGVISPYWNKRGLDKVLKTASSYGTKHTIDSTREYLTKKMKEKEYDFTGEDFEIEKDEHKTVTISINYTDEMRVFGLTLKEIEFTSVKTAYEIEKAF